MANGDKHVLAVVEGATENTVVVQALLDNLLARGLDPTLPRLFIVDGATRRSAKRSATPSVDGRRHPDNCQVHKDLVTSSSACPCICMRCVKPRRSVMACRPGRRRLFGRTADCATWPGVWSIEEPGVSGSILEGLDEILTVIRLGLPHELRRSLACTNIVENALEHGAPGQAATSIRWRLRRDGAQMDRRRPAGGPENLRVASKAYRQLPILRNALQEHLRKAQADQSPLKPIMKAA